ncbi:hATC-domain-containing protein [Sistotremastrum suecicum HHB10207 ss-3]|uniref:HATC-domain-containing protein n=1 Tax=Sistotremastrum suecicum HHB10207 ss-3 TaxID=1314776 RepID=A0A165WJ83_9AGAM|nr:hATC-domain-containing protein [Sistotremastrum suecicum HHB10207 ss-3]
MSTTSKPTLSSSMNAFVSLVDFLDTIKNSPTALANPSLLAGIAACRDKLLKWFDRASSETEYYYFATLLDPNFKDVLFKTGKNEEIFCEEWVRGCHESFVKTYNTEYSAGATHSRQEVNNVARELDEFEQLLESRFADDEPTVEEEDDEIKTYLREGRAKKVNPLEWWKKNKKEFPRLARMARDFLAIPGSSVSVERSFSIGRDLVSLRRASLSESTIREMMTTSYGALQEESLNEKVVDTVNPVLVHRDPSFLILCKQIIEKAVRKEDDERLTSRGGKHLIRMLTYRAPCSSKIHVFAELLDLEGELAADDADDSPCGFARVGRDPLRALGRRCTAAEVILLAFAERVDPAPRPKNEGTPTGEGVTEL